MTDPNTPTTPTNPQDLIDQALGGGATPTTPVVNPEPTSEQPTESTLPTPEPLTSPAATEEAPVKTEEVSLPPTETIPTELASAPVTPMMEEPPVDTKPMGEDMPLAFAAAAPVDTTPTKAPETYIEPVDTAAVVPPILTAPAAETTTPKKGGKKLKGLVVGLLIAVGLIGGVGLFGYQKYGSVQGLIAAVFEPKFIRVDGEVVRNPNYDPNDAANEAARDEYFGVETVENQTQKGTDPASCNGCLNGGWMVWMDGECKITGICNSGVPGKDTENPVLEQDANQLKNESSCEGAGKGYIWCQSVDSAGKAYAFCNTSGKGCNQAAIDKGYSIQVGILKCVEKRGIWMLDEDYYNSNTGEGSQNAQEVIDTYNEIIGTAPNEAKIDPCSKTYTTSAGSESYICKEGVKGEGNVVYSGGQCTALNGKKFTGNLNCFCGTVQVDTPNGHTSYSSTCGCNEPEDNTPNPSTPTITSNPTLMCNGLTRTPTTTPVIGDKITFTCAGSSTPAGAVSLSYKFRYSINGGSYVALNNKTATTSELTIAQCGSYKVQCQTCGTINGVLTCDPNWTGATAQ